MRPEIIPFVEAMLEPAAGLLARRHALDRRSHPDLPAAFENASRARGLIEEAWHREGVSGAAAVLGGELVGYLVGDLVTQAPWERSAWIRPAGCALAPEYGGDLLADLYAAVGATWVARGCFAHFALVSTADPVWLNCWFRLSFGVEQVYALLPLPAEPLAEVPLPPGIEIRRASADDSAHLERLSMIIGDELAREPVWAASLPELRAQRRAGWAELPQDPEARVWLALQAGQAIACQAYFPAASSAEPLFAPEGCIELSVAATLAAVRGRGVGRSLAAHALAWAHREGYRSCLTDFRSANRSASRFLGGIGFKPIGYRLVRRIDQRIAWAHGDGGD